MGIFDKECKYCKSKDHASSDCPNDRSNFLMPDTECKRCQSKEHATSNCPHDRSNFMLPDTKCEYCGSINHSSADCPQDRSNFILPETECKYCSSKEHSSSDCLHDRSNFILPDTKCGNCGSINHDTANCPQDFGLFGRPRTVKSSTRLNSSPQSSISYRTSNSSSTNNSGSLSNDWITNLFAWVIGIAIVGWLLLKIILPIVVLNSALVLTLLSLFIKKRRLLFAKLAIIGGAILLIDIYKGGLSYSFVKDIVKSNDWIEAFVYINTIAVGTSVIFLVAPFWFRNIDQMDKFKKPILNNYLLGIIVIFSFVSLPLFYHFIEKPFTNIESIIINNENSNSNGNEQQPIPTELNKLADNQIGESESKEVVNPSNNDNELSDGFKLDKNGQMYKGLLNEAGNLIGQGILIVKNDNTNTEVKYEGEFDNGNFLYGNVNYLYANGDRYIGEFKNNHREGKGILVTSNGTFEGDFENDLLVKGSVKNWYRGGDKYDGGFSNNKREGKGIFVTKNGSIYEGVFENNILIEGIVDLKPMDYSGNSYKGEFSNNIKQGKGLLITRCGSKYEGTFKDNMLWDGYVSETGCSGKKYEGFFKDGIPQ